MQLRFFSRSLPFSVLLLVILIAGGCGETEQPPTAISLDQIPVELGKAFASAKGDMKELSDLVVASVQSKEFSKASMAIDALARRSDLSKVQSRIATGAAMTISAVLLEAEAKGDTQAAKTLEIRRMTK